VKYLFLTTQYPPPLEGGSNVYLYNLVAHLPPEDVLVVTNARPSSDAFDRTQAYRIRRSGTEWRVFGKFEKVILLAKWILRFMPRLLKEQVELVHAADLAHSGVLAWLLKKFRGAPYIVFIYAEELNCCLHDRRRFSGSILRRMYRRVLQDADGVIGVSDYTLSLLAAFGVEPSKGIKIVPMVMPPRPVQVQEIAAMKAGLGLAAGQRIILSLARLSERKGIDNLIRAVPLMLASVPDVRLVIAGRGTDEARLRALVVEFKMEAAVVLAGFVPDTDKAVLYEVCDVFAMPHRELPDGDTEGCPTVFLEAGAHGKPVVGGRAGGVRDAIVDGETGFIVDGESPEQIAKALVAILTDQGLAARLGARARQRVLEDLSPEKGAKALLSYSWTLLGRKAMV